MQRVPRVDTMRVMRAAANALLPIAVAFATMGFVVTADARAVEPTAGFAPVDGFHPLVSLDRDSSGASVIRLQSALRDAGFYRGDVNGEYDLTTETAVITFQKYLGLDRTGDFGALDWIRLALLPPSDIPHRWDEPDRVEIDLTRQLLFVIRDHEITGILPTSTGSGQTYYSVRNGRNVRAATPRGDFQLRWHQLGWNCDSVTGWCVYNYWAFTEFYGIHGYLRVPPHPASHGCSRVHTWDSDWLEGQLYIGMPVHVWDEPPEVPGKPPVTPEAL